jgi:hypothetical protein
VFRGVVTASFVSLALIGCSAQSLSPLQRVNTGIDASHPTQAQRGLIVHPQAAILQWNPTSI